MVKRTRLLAGLCACPETHHNSVLSREISCFDVAQKLRLKNAARRLCNEYPMVMYPRCELLNSVCVNAVTKSIG